MDILSLKATLLKQNKIYRRQTLKKDALLFLSLAIILAALGGYAFSWSPTYPFAVGAAILLVVLVYLFLISKRSHKTEQQIERFIDKIKAGGKAVDIKQYEQYKIALPLPFSKLQLFPINYISVAFVSNPSKYYTFAVNKKFAQDIKVILKENSNNLTSAAKLDFLDADPSQDSDQEYLPLKNVDEFKDFLNQKLQFSLADIEEPKRTSKVMLVIASIILFTLAAGWLYYMYIMLFDNSSDLFSSPYDMLVVGVIFSIFSYGIYILYFKENSEEAMIANKRIDNLIGGSVKSRFKSKILHQVVKFINPQAQYVMHGCIDKDLIMKSGLFKDKEYQINGNDLIIGKYNGVRFQFSDLQITHRPLSAEPDASLDIVFQGQYFVARLRRNLPHPVYLVYRKARSIHFGVNNITGSEIELDDKDFMKLFDVYASSLSYAQEVLTPILVEGLKRVIKRIPGDYYISLCGDLLTIANNSGKDSFEIEYASSLIENDYEILIEFFKELYGDLTIINDLRLNEYA